MDSRFMNSKNSETSDPHRLLHNLSDKIDQKELINMLLYHILVFTIQGKYKSHLNIINL